MWALIWLTKWAPDWVMARATADGVGGPNAESATRSA
jgi:hypothetical protein